MKVHFLFFIALFLSPCVFAQVTPPIAQYPSPMQEHVRQHWRISQEEFSSQTIQIKNLLPHPISIYIPANVTHADEADLFIQCFGTKNIVSHAADRYRGRLIAVMVNLGSGSSVYARPFNDSSLFRTLLDSIAASLKTRLGHAIKFNDVIIGGFSAGYGAVRAILNIAANRKMIDGVLLLDGLHASYIPDRKVLAEGGVIDSAVYAGILAFCKLAVEKHSGKKFLFTHSEIFPGTFVSTTESADFLLRKLGLAAQAVLKWGPHGMQQISDSRKGHFRIMGFAGNTAPDHMDHLHNMDYFLNVLKRLSK